MDVSTKPRVCLELEVLKCHCHFQEDADVRWKSQVFDQLSKLTRRKLLDVGQTYGEMEEVRAKEGHSGSTFLSFNLW